MFKATPSMEGDGLAIVQEGKLTLSARTPSEILLFDLK